VTETERGIDTEEDLVRANDRWARDIANRSASSAPA
jgi:hypothetical protein